MQISARLYMRHTICGVPNNRLLYIIKKIILFLCFVYIIGLMKMVFLGKNANVVTVSRHRQLDVYSSKDGEILGIIPDSRKKPIPIGAKMDVSQNKLQKLEQLKVEQNSPRRQKNEQPAVETEQKSDTNIYFDTLKARLIDIAPVNDTKNTERTVTKYMSIIQEQLYLLKAEIAEKKKSAADKKICARYREEGTWEIAHMTNVWKTSSSSYDDVILVSQLRWTVEKAAVLRNLLELWTGPISLAVYVDENNIKSFIEITKLYGHILIQREIYLHLAMGNHEFYPVNYMRNIALNNTHFEYVYLNDIDFMPNADLYQMVKLAIQHGDLPRNNVLVVPAFEFRAPESITKFPKDKNDLIDIMMLKKKIHPFHYKNSPTQGATLYKTWLTASEVYDIQFYDGYEPYLILRKKECPVYDQKFLGRMGNKNSQTLEVYAKGMQFRVLQNAFSIHYPHKTTWSPPYLRCSIKTKKEFVDRMKKLYDMPSPPRFKAHRMLIIK